jgi:hypothetical protein
MPHLSTLKHLTSKSHDNWLSIGQSVLVSSLFWDQDQGPPYERTGLSIVVGLVSGTYYLYAVTRYSVTWSVEISLLLLRTCRSETFTAPSRRPVRGGGGGGYGCACCWVLLIPCATARDRTGVGVWKRKAFQMQSWKDEVPVLPPTSGSSTSILMLRCPSPGASCAGDRPHTLYN